MLNLVKVISTDYDTFKKRIVKLLRLGRNDVQTALEVSPFGLDSNPLKDMIAVYSPTNEQGKTVLLGYLNKNQKAQVGEFRTFCVDSRGTQIFYTWLKNNGTYEIGGNNDNIVRYAKLDIALQDEVNKINIELGKISAAIATAGGSYTPTPISVDILPSKVTEVFVI